MSADYDSPWKEALDTYFEAFLALWFPAPHGQIDWSRGYESLDKEFQQVVREAELGRRYVDKLVKVWTRDGAERWVLVHVEVQTSRDADFTLRMYVYNYRIFDRYNKPVASLAVLADDEPAWRPTEYRESVFGCETGIRFPMVKLVDLATQEAVLEASPQSVRQGRAGPPESARDSRPTRRPPVLEAAVGTRPVRAWLQRQGRPGAVPRD